MASSDKAYQLVKLKGPILPVDITKELEKNILLTSAILSELVSNKIIKISYTKIGGSPVYYVDEQKEKLQNLYKYLHEKEKKAYDLLKEKKVLYDGVQQPPIRVALRQIKDFAKPLEVSTKNRRMLFWKWYLLPNDDAKTIIKEILESEATKKQIRIKPKIAKGEEKPEVKSPKQAEQKLFEDKTCGDSFLEKLKKYFYENNINILSFNIIRKQRDIEFTVRIPSAVGKLIYYGRARNKKRCNEGDISSAYVQGEVKKLPVLFLTTGDLTKRANEMLKNEFKNITIKKI